MNPIFLRVIWCFSFFLLFMQNAKRFINMQICLITCVCSKFYLYMWSFLSTDQNYRNRLLIIEHYPSMQCVQYISKVLPFKP